MMKKVLFSLLFALLIVATPVKAWELTIPPQEHYAGELTDATVLNGDIYAIGLETYINSETGYLFQYIGNTTLFKISSNGTPLTKYTIIEGFCDEEEWPSYGVESIGDMLIVSGMSCVPRFKNETIWIMALDDDGGYRWGISLPGYLTQVKALNGSIVAAIAYGPKENRTPMMLWIDPTSGEITRAYLLPPDHGVLTFDIDENGEITAAGYDRSMLSWAGVIYPNGTVKLWDTDVEAWDGPSVWTVRDENYFLMAVGWSNGTYIINPINGSAFFVVNTYPDALMVLNGSPVMVSSYGKGKSILIRLNWNGSIRETYFLVNFTVQFVSEGLMGGFKGWRYYLAPFQPGREASLSLRTLPVEAKIVERTYSLTPINVSAKPFKPVIVTRNLEGWLAGLSVVTSPPGAQVYLNDVPMGETPLSLSLNPGNYTLRLVKYGYKNTTLNLTIHPGEWKNVTVDLKAPMGGLKIDSNPPEAEVYVDGEYKGKTPLVLSITPGVHNVSVLKNGYKEYTETLHIRPEEELTLDVSLIPLNGTLLITSTPANASVYVNGTFKGTTPQNLSLEPGKYTVTLVLKDYWGYSTTVKIPPNETKPLSVELEPLNGTLSITSTPSNASVYLNGTLTGMTPLNLSLKPGVYLINVTKDGYWNATTVTVKPNKTLTVSLAIPKKGLPLAFIFGVFALLVGGGAGGYLLMARRREYVGSQKSPEAVERAPSSDVITVKTRDGRAFGISHVGARDNNEDNLLVMKLPDAYLLAVADGLGGHNAGEVASQMAVDTLREVFEREYRKGMGDDEVKELLEKVHRLAHEKISENAVGEREGMGTTLVTAFVRNGKAIIANTGDSRAYLIRGGEVMARTKDHSLVQELVDKGEITPEEAKRHPMRNIITKALGIEFGVDFYEWELEKNDVLLLSSDGLHDYVDENKIVEITSNGKSAEEIGRRLIEEALPVTKDNVTVVVWR